MLFTRYTFLKKMFWLFLGMSMLHAADTNTTSSTTTMTRIMPLGDSLTYDNTYADDEKPRPSSQRAGYRSHLWYMLKDANYTADFVGSQVAGQGIKPPFDPDNEGHPGWTSFDIAEKVYASLIIQQPDIVLLHAGTNDHTTAPSGIESILNQIDYYEENSGKTVRVIVALLMDRRDADGRIPIFNGRLKKLVDSRIIKGDDLLLVDMYNGARISNSHYVDPTHPDSFGYRRMAQVWFNALIAPYNKALRLFPATIVNRTYIKSISFNDAANSVTFTTELPNTGITF